MEAVSTYLVVPFISGFFNVLIDQLATDKMRKLLLGRDSTVEQLSKLRMSLIKVKRTVSDAEKKQDDDPDAKSWLDSVKHALYDAEDLLDEIYTEALLQKAESETQSSQGVAQVFTGMITSLNPFYEGINSRIENINNELKILNQLIETPVCETSAQTCQSQLRRSQTTRSTEEYLIYGRDSEREQIINIVQDGVPKFDDRGKKTYIAPVPPVASIQKKIRVVAIVGMPGIGKTTLAKVVFDDPRVGEIFDFKACISVSEGFDKLEITKSILKSLVFLTPYVKEPDNDWELIQRMLYVSDGGSAKDLEIFQEIVRKKIAGRRILIVFNDVWDENFDAKWDDLRLLLQSVAAGSTIIVTTCNKGIARRFHPIFTLELHELSEEDCWSLIKERALADPCAVLDESLEDIGRRIAAKCRGFPLVAKALGCLLAGTSDIKVWETVEDSRTWDLSHGQKKILPAVLPPHLRRCFAYCSIFPRNYQFQKQKLLMLWMAEGLIDPATS